MLRPLLPVFLSTCLALAVPSVRAGQGRPFPAPALQTSGMLNTNKQPQALRLSRLRGRVVVLVFFFVEESHTPAALAQTRQLQAAYRYRALEVIGVHSPPPGWKPRPYSVPALDRAIEGPGAAGPKSVEDRLYQKAQRQALYIQQAAERQGVSFPIVMDHDQATWSRYGNTVYPTFQVIDHTGRVQATIVGTTSYPALSQRVGEMLRKQEQAAQRRRR